MKLIYLLAFATILFTACQKNGIDGNPPDQQVDEDTPVPPASPVSTTIYGMIKSGNNATFATGVFYTGEIWTTPTQYSLSNGIFNTGNTSFDAFSTMFSYELTNTGSSGYYKICNRIIPLTNSLMNYAYFNDFNKASNGTLINSAGGTINLSNYGSLTVGSNNLFELPAGSTPGFFSPNITAEIFSAYFNPVLPDFAIQVPCSFADINQKRVFLKSYGAVSLEGSSLNYRINQRIGFYNSTTGTLSLSIPQNLSANAPDSIEKWAFVSGKWINKGFAKKVNNSYVAQVDAFTTWNFAKAMKGVYRTITLKTDSGATMVNTTVRIKNASGYLAEAQTDINGTAICFLPAGEEMAVEVLNRWSHIDNQSVFYTGSIPASNTAANVEIIITAGVPNSITLKGKAFNCDGSVIKDGILKVHSEHLTATPPVYFKIENGNYSSSQIYCAYGPGSSIFNISATNTSTATVGVDTSVTITDGKININNVNTCPLDPNLFMNYTVDNIPYSITGNYLTPYSPYLVAIPNNNNTLISTAGPTGSNKGIQFSTFATTKGIFTGSGVGNLFINNIYYQQDVGQPMRIEFSRYDILSPGIVVGNADFYYRDNANVLHHVTATFRLKRV